MQFISHNGERFLVAHFVAHSAHRDPRPLDAFLSADISVPDAVSIITFATSDIDALLPTQLDRAGIAYLNPARDALPWSNQRKIQLLLATLPQIRTEYVLTLDGADVLLCGPLDEIFVRLAAYPGIAVLFGAQKWQYPPTEVEEVDRSDLGPFAYLNAGTVFGQTAAVADFYRHVAAVESPTRTEQLVVRAAFANHRDGVWFDHRCRIFQTFGDASLEDCDGGVVRVG